VQCRRSAHCPDLHGRCVAGTCTSPATCKSDKDCTQAAGVCDLATGYCVDCLASADCAAGESCAGKECIGKAPTCQTSKHCAGWGQVCDAKELACIDCKAHSDCATDRHCLQGVCAADVCKAGAAACKDIMQVSACSPAGDQLQLTSCKATESCQNGVCGPALCVPGERKCGGNDVLVCDDKGLSWSKLACGVSTTCVAANGSATCEFVVCTAGKSTCAGAVVQHCNAIGTIKSVGENCAAAGKACKSGKCVDMVCKPLSKVCAKAGDAVVTCAADGLTATSKACATGTVCEAGACAAVVCKAGESSCIGGVPHVCNAKGTANVGQASCAATAVCQAGQCVAKVCAKGERKCDGGKSLLTCNATLTGWDSAACASGTVCLAGTCTKQVCTANASFCKGSDVHACNATGTASKLTETCAKGIKCDGGKCLVPICKAGQTKCIAGRLGHCGSDKTSWLMVDCPAGTVCAVDACKKPTCTPGARRCDGFKALQCDALGIAEAVTEDCAKATQACKAGQCVPQVCKPAVAKCVGNVLTTCAKDALAWESLTCPSGSACLDADCKKVVCAPNSLGCDTYTAWKCSADGQTKKTTTKCLDLGKACKDGKCIDPVCLPGQSKCIDGQEAHCRKDLTGYDLKSCDDGDNCTVDGCDPDAAKCVNKALSGCSAANPSLFACTGFKMQAAFVQDHFAGSSLQSPWHAACIGSAPTYTVASSELRLTNTALSFCQSEPSTSWICTDADVGNQICRGFKAGTGDFDVRTKISWQSAQQMMGKVGLAVTTKDGTFVARVGYSDAASGSGVAGAVDVGVGAAQAGYTGKASAQGSALLRLRRESGVITGWVDGKQVFSGKSAASVQNLSIYSARYRKAGQAYPFLTAAIDYVWACR